jgi:alanine racemase
MPVSDDVSVEFNRMQIARFASIIDGVRTFNPGICAHLANSAAIINYPEAAFDMVRPGIMSYGYHPAPECGRNLNLVAAMAMKSSIVFSKRVKAGTGISYGLTYTAQNDCNIATIPVGYGDGYPRSLSNRAEVIIRGRRYPVAGRSLMDQISSIMVTTV